MDVNSEIGFTADTDIILSNNQYFPTLLQCFSRVFQQISQHLSEQDGINDYGFGFFIERQKNIYSLRARKRSSKCFGQRLDHLVKSFCCRFFTLRACNSQQDILNAFDLFLNTFYFPIIFAPFTGSHPQYFQVVEDNGQWVTYLVNGFKNTKIDTIRIHIACFRLDGGETTREQTPRNLCSQKLKVFRMCLNLISRQSIMPQGKYANRLILICQRHTNQTLCSDVFGYLTVNNFYRLRKTDCSQGLLDIAITDHTDIGLSRDSEIGTADLMIRQVSFKHLLIISVQKEQGIWNIACE